MITVVMSAVMNYEQLSCCILVNMVLIVWDPSGVGSW
jgi:hypothetical protein